MDTSDLFSNDYRQAREKFLAAANALGLRADTRTLPSVCGPDGEALYLDAVMLGPDDAAEVLILQSATHGVEGFCGSACQTGFLSSDLVRTLDGNQKVLLIHALNPYGFAWLRRVNEDNVDLNRNFVDHRAGRYPDNPGYVELRDAISPTRLDAEAVKSANALLRSYLKRHGAAALQAAITQGQYIHPEGLYYGGTFETWSNRQFRDLVTAAASAAEKVIMIDFHTGLGPYGYGEPIVEIEPDTPTYAAAKRIWGADVKTTQTGESVSSQLSGTIDGAVPRIVPHADTLAMALEFGTYSTAEVFQATRADNWLHQHGDVKGPEAPAIKEEIRRVFYPDKDDWKAMVWSRTCEIIGRAIEGLKHFR